jgi:hypothetical protein
MLLELSTKTTTRGFSVNSWLKKNMILEKAKNSENKAKKRKVRRKVFLIQKISQDKGEDKSSDDKP